MASRTWVKLYCHKWLEGTIREETPAVRGIFVDLLALAGDGLYGDSGEIGLQGGVGLSTNQLKSILHLTHQQWVGARDRLLKTDRILINSRGVISITNWGRYQSEYERQKPFRSNSKLQAEVISRSYTGDKGEGDKGEGDKREPVVVSDNLEISNKLMGTTDLKIEQRVKHLEEQTGKTFHTADMERLKAAARTTKPEWFEKALAFAVEETIRKQPGYLAATFWKIFYNYKIQGDN